MGEFFLESESNYLGLFGLSFWSPDQQAAEHAEDIGD